MMRWFTVAAIFAAFWSVSTAHWDFSRNMHSHNDYERNLPLFDGLASGVKSFEADLHLVHVHAGPYSWSFTDLAVSHKRPGFRGHQSFKSLYLDPLEALFDHANSGNASVESFSDLYGNIPSTSLQLLREDRSLHLLLDYKDRDASIVHSFVINYLSHLRSRNLLTTYDAVTGKLTPRPITIVCSGSCRLEDVLAQQPRDVFFDAPLDKLDQFEHGPEVAPLASASLTKLFGNVGSTNLNEGRMKKIRPMLENAYSRGIQPRFYDNPTWPSCVRNAVLKKLKQSGVYWMNVDDLRAGVRVDDKPESCIGIHLCRLWLSFQILMPTAIGLWGLRWILDARRRVKLMRMVQRNQ